MKIKDIANQFRKAGINVRPKSLQTVQKAISDVQEAFQQKQLDVEMEVENDLKKSNDFSDPSSGAKVVKFFIKRFKEIKSCGGNSESNILEQNTAQQIYLSLTLQDLEEDKAQDITKDSKKSMATLIAEKSKKLEETKEKQIDDPIFDYLKKEIIILDSFKDIPEPAFKSF